jgi:hypothetical protein
MTDYKKTMTQAQDQAFETAKQWIKIQEQAFAGVQSLRVGLLPDQFPTLSEMAEARYAFVGNVLQLQKETSLRFLKGVETAFQPAQPAAAKV